MFFDSILRLKKFYHNYIFVFTSSYIFYTFLCVLASFSLIYFSCFNFQNSFLFNFLLVVNSLFFMLHGIHGLIHILEDYTFDMFCRILFVFLANLLLIRVLLFVII